MSRIIKVALLSIIFVLCAASAGAQQSAPSLPAVPPPFEPSTRLEALDAQVGSVLVKNSTYIGGVSGFSGIVMVTSYEFVDVQTGRKDYGIGIELRETGRSDKEGRDARTYVDYDEIDALTRAMDYISRIERSATLENFEAQFRTRGELQVATFIRPNGSLQSEVSIGFFRRAVITISLGKLADFRKLIADAKTALDKIR
ncbi:MAG TPA: hypothetical protein VJS44_06485 [Pyrinomonadaceae bacterium]|nr:hypothetical protein [Pyrinomonadaceae bacterium]